MPRPDLVNRELRGTEVEVFTVNLKTQEGKAVTVRIRGTYKTHEGLLKAIQRKFDTDDVKYMKIISAKPFRKLYGMPVDEFYKNAVELNPETRYPLNTEKEGK